MNETDLLNTALVSLLIGGGSYTGLRGIRDFTKPTKTNEVDNELEVTLPSSRVPKLPTVKYAETSWWEDLISNGLSKAAPVTTAGLGIYGGFRGASAIYDSLQNKQIAAEKEKVKNEYLKALQHANTKVGSLKTPLVDKFLEGCLTKQAESALGHFLGLGSSVVKDVANNIYYDSKDSAEQMAKSVASSTPVGLGAGALALLGLGTTGTTYYLANRFDENKEEAKRKSNIPTEIRLNVQ